jgi:hypothetical protein
MASDATSTTPTPTPALGSKEKLPENEKKSQEGGEVVAKPIEDDIYPKGAKLVVIIIALCLAVFLVALDQTIIATAIPRITDRFNSVSDIGWYGSVSASYFIFIFSFSFSTTFFLGVGIFLDHHIVTTNIRTDIQDIQCMYLLDML